MSSETAKSIALHTAARGLVGSEAHSSASGSATEEEGEHQIGAVAALQEFYRREVASPLEKLTPEVLDAFVEKLEAATVEGPTQQTLQAVEQDFPRHGLPSYIYVDQQKVLEDLLLTIQSSLARQLFSKRSKAFVGAIHLEFQDFDSVRKLDLTSLQAGFEGANVMGVLQAVLEALKESEESVTRHSGCALQSFVKTVHSQQEEETKQRTAAYHNETDKTGEAWEATRGKTQGLSHQALGPD